MKLKICELNLELQTRATTNGEVVNDYAEEMKAGREFPPVKVFRASKDALPLYLADGFHRVYAAAQIGRTEIDADIVYGPRGAALSYALKANAKHGLRRSNEDKRHALQMAWENREILFPEPNGKDENGKPTGLPSSTQLAAICCVSQPYAYDFIKNFGGYNVITPSPEEAESERAVGANLKAGKDCHGTVIPENLLPVFRSKELKEMIASLKGVRKSLAAQIKAGDMAFVEIGQLGLIDVENAINCFEDGRPYSVCLACHGTGCDRCRGRGFLSCGQYRRQPREYRV